MVKQAEKQRANQEVTEIVGHRGTGESGVRWGLGSCGRASSQGTGQPSRSQRHGKNSDFPRAGGFQARDQICNFYIFMFYTAILPGA